MIVDYYETSPRKEVEFDEFFEEQLEREKKDLEKREKQKEKLKRQKVKEEQAKIKRESKRNVKVITGLCIFFAVFSIIGYRVFLINNSLKEKENLKVQLAEIKKQNEQLQVTIEQQMNLNTIEQEAKEKLGMRKLDNNQKVYVNLNKEDYTQSSDTTETESKNETWWSKLLKDLFNIE